LVAEVVTMSDRQARDPDIPAEPARGSDWADYYRHTQGREPRPPFLRGVTVLQAAGAVPGQAIEIGFGDGTETLALLWAGWRVLAIDPAPEAAATLRAQVPADAADRLEIRSEPAEDVELPPFDLLYAGYSLPFLDPARFGSFWERVRSALRPGGFLVVNVFGLRDSWAGRDGMSFIGIEAAQQLVDGLEVLGFEEEDQDGDSFLGPKHWHVFHLIARRPDAEAG
jgi:SAM-dependent methyltransferase